MPQFYCNVCGKRRTEPLRKLRDEGGKPVKQCDYDRQRIFLECSKDGSVSSQLYQFDIKALFQRMLFVTRTIGPGCLSRLWINQPAGAVS